MAGAVGRRAVLGGIAGLLATPPRASRAQETIFFRIGTGSASGTYFQVGELIASAISNPPGSRSCEDGGSCGVPGLLAAAQSSEGSVANVEAIAQGAVESGFSQADIAYWAFAGEMMFGERGRVESLRGIAKLYAESVHVVARADSGIATLAGLAGKRVSLNEEASGTAVDARHILAAFGLGEDAIVASYLSAEKSIEALAAGEIDAFFYIAGFPAPAVVELAERTPIVLLPVAGPSVADLLLADPFFNRDFIPNATYTGVGVVETLSIGALWLVSASVPADLVYGITRALWHERTRATLESGHPKGKDIRLEYALAGLVVPLHPGAERYYRDVGLVGTP
jgi:hypothetical protein